ncbi:MAG: hypothetical protein UV37_C0017G0002 [Candidatus Collierbacteria bacterium GW2011_GWA1_42_60]|uniref:Uncharacterized protein n=1 Tax=Candidatus Collierbacteria bacterium GW2011_GWA2_42_17 TaxID=1618378 RepID=A0A0G0Z3B7_9BACT|nr:MAG: hypothetical protein UU94_C0008G0005 [Candidatus Collierbacteria bacterium GW2011_GWB2_42_12]KKS43210.1 MAG: hypothetical protein UV06_C0002G0112 [Candidatus Collierbacteria bacterium GW2011_GWA2_42_17]KKS64280.1 MAG: hypothetical protein UV32_C0018G0002 [Candidatus Collierbacteria bacterium GW2011_GWF2_42_51]KKS66709.1 MAG: hypothetical protein UV37_C0017G0002 [Candidatus Collierbacteria bacterium GW2011_GWA1_42_60]HAI22799.1 hypothetical protein [Candidatus Collierbacteria bacterium]
MSYYVVFEYTTKAGGYAGIRTAIDYQNKENFTLLNPTLNGLSTVIAEGISEGKSYQIIQLTPEICLLTAAIEKIDLATNGSFNFDKSHGFLREAWETIYNNRLNNKADGLVVKPDFQVVEPTQEYSNKNHLMIFVKNKFTNTDGSIDDNLQIAIMDIEGEIYKMTETKH